ncbi:MAG: hypothetical protein RMZ41_009735 [Nostoc sp. DedVER02]|uniref:hypothetical protein n=1 Tax=unclassified Nostoc TaxID=2593658 RepID=UPI002AD5B0E8|nr:MULTISPECIES: hypothetical protein [unclassified Nostoc]MDZ7985666.1 hypothetical protein [Nostoc sp. DedVER02]MDZ8111322.1 hypothetical protein [Nostoc sp. DedVER01b]
MVVARKSAISTKGNWFQRNSILSLGRRRSKAMESAARSASTPATPATPATPLSSPTQQRSSKNLATSSTNQAVIPKSVKKLGRQQAPNLNEKSNAIQKRSGVDFLRFPEIANSGTAPLWLLRLYTFHRYSTVLAFLLVASTLAVYGWTVYSQELWGKSYRRLQNLQRHERMLTTTNATLTNKMAKEAEQSTAGLVSPTPEGMIFLSPPSHSPKSAPSNITPSSQTQQQTLSPLGY